MQATGYFIQSKGAFPPKGSVGVESEWLDVGILSVPSGDILAADFYSRGAQDSYITQVLPGTYRVLVKGMDFDGHRRTSRLRACSQTIPNPESVVASARIAVDCGLIRVHDATIVQERISPRYSEEFWKELRAAAMAAAFEPGGMKCVRLTFGNEAIDVAFTPTGLGDGTFDLYRLLNGHQCVGIEIEFLAAVV